MDTSNGKGAQSASIYSANVRPTLGTGGRPDANQIREFFRGRCGVVWGLRLNLARPPKAPYRFGILGGASHRPLICAASAPL